MFNKKNQISASSVTAISISADVIGTNNEYGHFTIGNEIGKTCEVKIDNKILIYKGGLLIDIKEGE